MQRRMMVAVFLTAVFVLGAGAIVASASTIQGTVYDNNRNSLAQVAVELYNRDNNALVNHTMTDGTGRYTFEGLGNAFYTVKVLPFRYDMDEQSQEIEIRTIGNGGYDFQIADFYLTPRRGTLAAAQATVIVAQEIPSAAKDNYNTAVKLIKKGQNDEAVPLLEQALKDFPAYFLANDALGSIYFNKQDYEHAAPRFMEAVKVYDKSPTTLYMLGVSLTKLNYAPAAVVSLQAASTLAPASSAVSLALGHAQRLNKDLKGAEASYLNAKKQAKSENAEIYQSLAGIYADMKQYDKAAANLEAMLKAGHYSDQNVAAIKEQIKKFHEKAAGSTPAAPAKTN